MPFSFINLKTGFGFMACIISYKKNPLSFLSLILCICVFIFLSAFKISSSCGLWTVWLWFCCVFSVWGLLRLLSVCIYSFHQILKSLGFYFFKYTFSTCPHLFGVTLSAYIMLSQVDSPCNSWPVHLVLLNVIVSFWVICIVYIVCLLVQQALSCPFFKYNF